MRMSGYEVYRLRSGLAGKYRIGLNIVRRGKIGVKGLFLEYGEYSAEYSPTPSLKPLSRCKDWYGGIRRVCWLLRAHMVCVFRVLLLCALKRMFNTSGQWRHFRNCIWQHCECWMLMCCKVLLDCVLLGYSWRVDFRSCRRWVVVVELL